MIKKYENKLGTFWGGPPPTFKDIWVTGIRAVPDSTSIVIDFALTPEYLGDYAEDAARLRKTQYVTGWGQAWEGSLTEQTCPRVKKGPNLAARLVAAARQALAWDGELSGTLYDMSLGRAVKDRILAAAQRTAVDLLRRINAPALDQFNSRMRDAASVFTGGFEQHRSDLAAVKAVLEEARTVYRAKRARLQVVAAEAMAEYVSELIKDGCLPAGLLDPEQIKVMPYDAHPFDR